MADTHYGDIGRKIENYSLGSNPLDRVAQGTKDLLNRAYVSGVSDIVPSFRRFYDTNPLLGNATLFAGALGLAFLGSYALERLQSNPGYQPVVTREAPAQQRTLENALAGQERANPFNVTPNGSVQMSPETRKELERMADSFQSIDN